MTSGATLSECPISTADGVKTADIAWASAECFAQLGNRSCVPRCPEICVEILSPSNTEAEISEKMALYFDAGAREVWVCDSFGAVTFFAPDARKIPGSQLCPGLPPVVDLGSPK
jgi:Uma2 family endonuclease